MYFLIEMWYNENKSIILVLIGCYFIRKDGDVRVGAEAFFVWF